MDGTDAEGQLARGQGSEGSRRRERPRSTASRAAILAVAVGLVGEVGCPGLTIEGIAARAGCGKQTIHRWWPSKAHILLESLATKGDLYVTTADHGSYAADLRAFLGETHRLGRLPEVVGLLRTLMAQAQADPAFGEVFRGTFLERRRDALRTLTARAAARGDLPAAPREDTVLDVVFGTLGYSVLATRQPFDEPLPDDLVGLLAGTRPRPVPAPRPPPGPDPVPRPAPEAFPRPAPEAAPRPTPEADPVLRPAPEAAGDRLPRRTRTRTRSPARSELREARPLFPRASSCVPMRPRRPSPRTPASSGPFRTPGPRSRLAGHRPHSTPPPREQHVSTSSPTVLVTGATDGLGRALAQRLADDGAQVILHGRNRAALAAVAEDCAARAVAAGGVPPRTVLADLSDLDQVRRLATEVRTSTDRLDVLVNNAGIGGGAAGKRNRETSHDGYELRFAVNYLSGFLLTLELLPLLRASAPARVVLVASLGQAPLDFEDLMLERGYDGGRAYGQSKLAQIMFGFELAEHLPADEVTVNSLHPATYMPTKMVLEARGNSLDSLETGTEATHRMVLGPGLRAVTGRFRDRTREATAHTQAYDREARGRLWRASLELTGATDPFAQV